MAVLKPQYKAGNVTRNTLVMGSRFITSIWLVIRLVTNIVFLQCSVHDSGTT